MTKEDYPIEKGIPVPPTPEAVRMTVWADVVKDMEIGDSFAFKDGDDYREPLVVLEKRGRAGEVRKDSLGFRLWRVK